MARREYVGGAVETTITDNPLAAGATTINIDAATGWPTGSGGKFAVDIDFENSSYEKVLVNSRSGTVLTLSSASDRGYDDTTDTAHNSGATIRVVGTSVDLDEANAHINNAGAVKHTSAALATDSVGSDQIAAGAVDTAELATDAVTTVKITDANVTLAKLAPDSVDGTKIADNAIDSEHYTDGSIDSAHFAAGAVDTAAIGTGAVDTDELAASAVTTAKINDSAVTNAKAGFTTSVYSPTFSGWAKGDGTEDGTSMTLNKLVFCEYRFVAGPATTFGSALSFTLPTTAARSTHYLGEVGEALDATGSNYPIQGRIINSGGSIQLFYKVITSHTGTVPIIQNNGGLLDTTNPFNWTTSDSIEVSFWYFAA